MSRGRDDSGRDDSGRDPDDDDLALAALADGDYARAVELLAAAIETAPDDPRLLCNHGAALQALGRPREAIAAYRRAAGAGMQAALLSYNLGSALAQAGDVSAAEAAYRDVIARDDQHADARGNLGVLLFEQGRLAEAAAHLAEAVRLAPDRAHTRCNLGAVLCTLGEFDGAVAAYREACARAPASVQAHAGLGAALCARGDLDDGIAALERAIALERDASVARAARGDQSPDPSAAEVRRQLAAVLGRSGDLARAERIYRDLAARAPDDAWATNGLGAVLAAQGRTDEATAAFRRAVELSPAWADAHYNLGVSLERAEQAEAAAANYRAALARAPDHLSAIKNLAGVLRRMGEIAEPLALYRRAVELDPDDAAAAHLAAALAGETTARAPEGYVRQVFDQYAPRYDGHMQGDLGYRAPEALADAVAGVFTVSVSRTESAPGEGCDDERAGEHTGERTGEHTEVARAIDLGCGTGLVGRALRALAARPSPLAIARLVGVDLSPRMLEAAAAAGGYEELVEADVLAYLADRASASCELIVAADVLIYLGDLAALFAEVGRVLAPGGVWAFTVEDLDAGPADDDGIAVHVSNARDDGARPGYALRDTGRYVHGRAYLERLAAAAGLAPPRFGGVTLRLERGVSVPGLVATAIRPR